MNVHLRQKFLGPGIQIFGLIWLLIGCMTMGVTKPNPATGERGGGTTSEVDGVILGSQALYRNLISLHIKVDIGQAKNCQRPTPLKNLSIVLMKMGGASGSMVHQYPVEKSSFVMPLTIAEGRYIAELRDERLGRTLERKELDVSAHSGPWLFADPC